MKARLGLSETKKYIFETPSNQSMLENIFQDNLHFANNSIFVSWIYFDLAVVLIPSFLETQGRDLVGLCCNQDVLRTVYINYIWINNGYIEK